MLLIHELPGGWAWWGLGSFVFINQQNAEYESNCRNSSIYIPSSRLHLQSLFLPYLIHHLHPELSWYHVTCTSNPSCSKTHPITYKTLYVRSGLSSATFNCIIMLTPQMWIDCQLAAMAPKGSPKGKGKATSRAKMPTSVINRHLSVDQDRIMGFSSKLIGEFIWI